MLPRQGLPRKYLGPCGKAYSSNCGFGSSLKMASCITFTLGKHAKQKSLAVDKKAVL